MFVTDKLDKKAEMSKMEKLEQERYDREEEMREMSSKSRYRYHYLKLLHSWYLFFAFTGRIGVRDRVHPLLPHLINFNDL